MRFAVGFLAVMFLAVMVAPSSLLARSDTVRGCVAETTHQGVWLVVGVVEDRDYQAYYASDPFGPGQRLLLVGDDDLLEELSFREGHTVQVTGLLNPETSSPAIVEPPAFQPPGGGNFPGAGSPPNPRVPPNPRLTTRVRSPRTGRPAGPFAERVPTDVILVEEYRTFGPGCHRPPGRF